MGENVEIDWCKDTYTHKHTNTQIITARLEKAKERTRQGKAIS